LNIPGFTAATICSENAFRNYDDSTALTHHEVNLNPFSMPTVVPALVVNQVPGKCYQVCRTEITYEVCGSGNPPPMCQSGTREVCHTECVPAWWFDPNH
jgi:hypothetical protein